MSCTNLIEIFLLPKISQIVGDHEQEKSDFRCFLEVLRISLSPLSKETLLGFQGVSIFLATDSTV